MADAPAPSLDARHKTLILAAAILGSTVVTVDATVVNVALPAIRADLGGGFAGQQWTANAYLVTLASLILVGGALGDIFGERRVFSLGVLGFGLTSVVCALASTIEVLVLGRALQGAAGALLTPAALAVIVGAFPAAERGKAVGSWTAWGAVGTVLGPLVGGQLVDAASWRLIFAINVPLVLATLFLIGRYVPEGSASEDSARVDFAGGALCALGLAGFTFGLIRQPDVGFGDPTCFVALVGGILLFAAFLLYESRASHPMLRLDLFANHNFAVGNVETLAMYAGLSLLFFFLLLFLQGAAGYSAVAAGTAALPVTILMFLLSRRFGALADRLGPRLFMGVGPLVMAGGLALLTPLGTEVDYATDLLPPLVIFGVGLSMTVAPLTATVLADVEERNAGIASGINNAVARVAGLLGIAIVGAIVAGSYGDQADSSVAAFHLAMTISASLVAVGGLLGLLGIRNPDKRRPTEAGGCPGGQLVGAPRQVARDHRRGQAATPASRAETPERIPARS